jgi:hypothetical protein
MPIYLHWLGLSRVRETNYFTNNELALINVVLNLTRLTLVKESDVRLESTTEELAKLKLFETKVKGSSLKVLKSHKYHLGCSSMLEFATTFMSMLNYLSGCSLEEFKECINPYMTGMKFDGKFLDHLNLRQMKSFGVSLHNNCYFCASLAGCKRVFHNDPKLCFKVERPEQRSIVHINRLVRLTTKRIYYMLRELVFPVCTPRSVNDGHIQYHFDLGIEFSPLKEDNVSFLLSGTKTMRSFKRYLLETRPHVVFVGDPRIADPDDSSEDPQSTDQEDSDSESQEDDTDVMLMDDSDMAFIDTGEVRLPSTTRHISQEGSGDEG